MVGHYPNIQYSMNDYVLPFDHCISVNCSFNYMLNHSLAQYQFLGYQQRCLKTVISGVTISLGLRCTTNIPICAFELNIEVLIFGGRRPSPSKVSAIVGINFWVSTAIVLIHGVVMQRRVERFGE